MNIYFNSFKIIVFTYIIFFIPLIIFLLNRKNYKSKKNIYKISFYSILYGILTSSIFYIVPKKFFSFFTNVNGIINFCSYASKIIFITSSIIGIQIIILLFFYFQKQIKKTAILFLLKTAVLAILILILYNLYHITGFLYAIPISDIVFLLIELYVLNKSFLKNN